MYLEETTKMKTVWLFILIIKTILEIPEAGASIVSTNDKEPDQISLSVDTEQNLNITDNDKPILRYGFQKTQDCHVFAKAFLCIRKCLDLGYEIAHADKQCLCTCKRNRVIAKHKKPYFGPTKWQLGVPTTSLPSWATKQSHTKLSMKDPMNDFEIYGDVPFPDNQQINVTELETTKEKDATTSPESNEPLHTTIAPDANNEQNPATDPNNAQDATMIPNHNEIKDATTVSDPNEANDASTISGVNEEKGTTTAPDPNEATDTTTAPDPTAASK